MGKDKLKRFAENKTLPTLFEPEIEEVQDKYILKNKWAGEYFKNTNPITLELGCGRGEYTIGLAEKYPNKNFIGIDRKGARIWRGAKTAHEDNLRNAAFLRTRLEFLNNCFGKNEINEIWITFPDPHLKLKKENRRLTSPYYLDMYQDILSSESIIHLKTDNQYFYNYTLRIIQEGGHHLIFDTADLYADSCEEEAKDFQTFYEHIFLKENTRIKYIKFRLMPKKLKNNQDHESKNDSFFQRVFEVVKLIPYGRATSYGAIANYLGSKGSARMVGWAMNASHASSDAIPAHRVVNRNGMLTGKHHFGSPDIMKQLLENEGVKVKDDKIVAFNLHFWDPLKELL